MVAVMAGSALFVGVMLERVAENARVDGWLGDALRLSVNVQSSDGQFEISNCYKFYYANP